MPKTHTVAQGECLSSIARKYGFADYHKIYDHSRNAGFKKRRPNPNLIYPGDVLFIPDVAVKEESGGTKITHKFVVSTGKRYLRLVPRDPCWHPLANEEYEFRLGGATHRGRTDGSGLLVREIPDSAGRAQLVMRGYTWDLEIGHLNPMDGDVGDGGVSGCQGRLLNLGYDAGPVDGDLGPRTTEALKRFQVDFGLPDSGVLDDATRTKLTEAHGS